MKISKLFHWLYAFIMLMPVFFIGGRVLYTVFNKNAKDSYSGNYGITYKYESNEINSENDTILGNIYNLNINDLDTYYYDQGENGYIDFTIVSGNLELLQYDPPDVDEMNIPTILSKDYTIELVIEENYFYSLSITLPNFNGNYISFYLSNLSINFNNLIVQLQDYDLGGYYNIDNWLSYTNYNEIVNVETSETLDNAFSYSVNQLNENPLFAWAKDSFLVTPFAYITGLFGLEATSPINTLLSYWLSISIIWLVFDLVMYLPLLFHRWLDKGVLE